MCIFVMEIQLFVICFILFGNFCFATNGILNQEKCDLEKRDRIDCGWSGMHREQCESMGCCFNRSGASMPICYIGSNGNRTLERNCDFRKPTERRDCGWPGITKSQCETKSCCFDNRVVGVNHCFHTNQAVVTTSTGNSAAGPRKYYLENLLSLLIFIYFSSNINA